MSLDAFFSRRYDRRRYNCAHLAIDVWEHLTGRQVPDSVAGFLLPDRGQPTLGHVLGVTVHPEPVDPCFVLMRSRVLEPHVGIFHRGRILHFAGNDRVHFQRPEYVTLGYSRVRYFTC